MATLEAAMAYDLPADQKRDIAIIRFAYTVESLWAALRAHLAEVEGMDARSPKSCIRGAHEVGLLSTEQTRHALSMVNDRNQTVHAYNEELAVKIFGRLPEHVAIIQALLDGMRRGAEAG